MHSILQKLKAETKDSLILENESMTGHTSFKIGGCADVFIDASVTDIGTIIDVCANEGVPITVIGNGSNILVGDKGIRGVTIALGSKASGITGSGNCLEAESGALLSSLSKFALRESLSGLEFAGGIPGSVGGGVFMNAGAYDGEIKDVLVSVDYYDYREKRIKSLEKEQCDLSYRHSIFSEQEIGIILSAKFSLKPKDTAEISGKMADFSQRRKDKQPLEYPSAGSTFKRPEGFFAGKLIEDAGLKGFKVGGALVSEKHAGFVINAGGATANDVRILIKKVSEKVYKDTGVSLFPEVKFVGEF